MEPINKAKIIRESLRLTVSDAGRKIAGYSGKQAYDIWAAYERNPDQISAPRERYFDLIMLLITARDLKTPGACRALDLFLSIND